MLLNQSTWRPDNLNLNKQTNLAEDECELKSHDLYNNKQADYRFKTFNDDSRIIGGIVQSDSRIRDGTLGNIITQTKNKSDKILECRPYITTPFMGAGQASSTSTDTQTDLRTGEFSSKRKSCNELSGISINRFIPLIPEIKREIQNPKNTIETAWVRGGKHTRMTLRNMDYMKSCGFK